MSGPLRVEMKFKNAALYNALRAKFPPSNIQQKCADIRAAAKHAGIDYGQILGYLSLSLCPWSKRGEPTQTADKLSIALGIDAEELFPRRLYTGVFPKRLAAEVDPDRYLSILEAKQQHLLPTSTEDLPTNIFPQVEARQAIERSLQTLTPREEKVLRLRFGLDDGEGKTLLQVGECFGLSVERMRQIEARALRHMRHPSRSSKLREFVDF